MNWYFYSGSDRKRCFLSCTAHRSVERTWSNIQATFWFGQRTYRLWLSLVNDEVLRHSLSHLHKFTRTKSFSQQIDYLLTLCRFYGRNERLTKRLKVGVMRFHPWCQPGSSSLFVKKKRRKTSLNNNYVTSFFIRSTVFFIFEFMISVRYNLTFGNNLSFWIAWKWKWDYFRTSYNA